MDKHTEAHLDRWIAKQFPYDLDYFSDQETREFKADLVAQFDSDPEHYAAAGWWRVYEDAGF